MGNQDEQHAPVEVSVVMPTFNAAEYIGLQLEALANQDTDASWELIVSDNGSTDGTAEVIGKFGARLPIIRVIDSSDKKGAAHARNAGARVARGRYVIFCDSDDVVDPLWVNEMRRALRQAPLVAGPLATGGLNSEEVRGWRTTNQETGLSTLFGVPYVVSANMGCEAALFRELGGFDETFETAAGEDVDFSLRAMKMGAQAVFAPAAIVEYRYRATFQRALEQARSYGLVSGTLFDRHRDVPLLLPTVGDDARQYFHMGKTALKARLLRRPIPGSVRWTFAYTVVQSEALMRRPGYWRWGTSWGPREASWARVQRNRMKKIAAAVAQKVDPADIDESPVGSERPSDPWQALALLRSSLDVPGQRRVGAGLLANAGVEIRVARGGVEFLLNPSMDSIVLDVMEGGGYSSEEIESVAGFVQDRATPGETPTIINVGANIGTTALHFARRDFRVVAVEPANRAYELLRANVERNGLEERIITVQAAVTAEPGEVELVVGDNLSTSELRGEHEPEELGTEGDAGLHVEVVEGRPLTEILTRLGIANDRVSLVWSDTEGAERGVIESGGPLWSRGTPLWVEIRPNAIRDHGSIQGFVQTASTHFTHYSTLDDLKAGRAARPIDSLRDFVDDVGYGRWDFTNVLLIRVDRADGSVSGQ